MSLVTIDKTTWGPGPWQDEPDYLHWVDEATNLDCLVVRAGSGGHLCGYVGVPEGHPWHGRGYSECTRTPPCEDGWCEHSPDGQTNAHGGITYASACSGRICHHAPGRPEPVWWFGFDCAHCDDIGPAMEARMAHLQLPNFRGDRREYRTLAYVQSECAKLAAQLAAVTT